MPRPVDFRFYAITDSQRLSYDGFLGQIERAIAFGLRTIQIREKQLPPGALTVLAAHIKQLVVPSGVRVLINSSVDLAKELDLDGVHLTESSVSAPEARKILGPDKWIGVSVHDLAGATRAEKGGADFIVLGPVAPTLSKSNVPAMRPEEFKMICSEVKIPVFALGGVNSENAEQWLKLGAHGIAGISIWMEPEGLEKRMSALKEKLGSL